MWQSEMINMSSRIEGVITFTLIRYVSTVLNNHISPDRIILYCVWLLQFIFGLSCLKVKNSAFEEMLKIFKKLSILLINQCIISKATREVSTANIESSIVVFTELTAILAFAFIFCQIIHLEDYTDRGLTLLLYMYTDASNLILKSFNLEFAAVCVSAALYVVMHVYKSSENKSTLLDFFLRAINMICVNLILNAFLLSSSVTNIHSVTMISILFLFLLSALEKIWNPLTESKDYALWRSAQNMYELYSKYEHDMIIAIFLLLTFVIIKTNLTQQAISKLSTIMNLIALFLVNVVLGSVSQSILSIKSTYQIIVMLIHVILIHYGTYCILLIA